MLQFPSLSYHCSGVSSSFLAYLLLPKFSERYATLNSQQDTNLIQDRKVVERQVPSHLDIAPFAYLADCEAVSQFRRLEPRDHLLFSAQAR